MRHSSRSVPTPVSVQVHCGPSRDHHVVFQPAGGSLVTVILLPGSGRTDVDGTYCSKKTQRDLAISLSCRGISSIRFSKRPTSPRDALDYLDEYLVPMQAALREAPSYIDPAPLVLVGHSLGGHILPMASLVLGNRVVAGVLLNAPYRSLQSTIRWQAESYLSNWSTAAFTLPDRYSRLAATYSPLLALQQRPLPILVVSSGLDALVHPGDADSWEASGSFVERLNFPDLDHFLVKRRERSVANQTLPGEISTDLLDSVSAWIKRAC